MARIGPNQDINDPKTLEDLRYLATDVSLLAKQKFEEVNQQPLSGELAVPIETEVKFLDGNTQLISGKQPVAWEQAAINTYIDQPEKFRQYWRLINDYANNIIINNDIETIIFFDFGLLECNSTNFNVYEKIDGKWQTRKGYHKVCTFPVSATIFGLLIPGTEYAKLPEPLWVGNGPTNYNFNTFSQLQFEFNSLINGIHNITPPLTDSATGVAGGGYYAVNNLRVVRDLTTPWYPSYLYVYQSLDAVISPPIIIHNPTTENITLNLSMALSVGVGVPDIAFIGSKFMSIGSNYRYASTEPPLLDSCEAVGSIGGTLTHEETITVTPKGWIGVGIPATFRSEAIAYWWDENNSLPEGGLNSFLCNLSVAINAYGYGGNFTFTP